MHTLSVIQGIDAIRQVRRIAWDDWRGTYGIDKNTEVPRVITKLYWYMTEEEYEAFATHENTLDNPYWSDNDFGRRRIPYEIATPLAQEWVRRYGVRRAKMGYYDKTPINTLLRKREISTGQTRICYEDYREAMATVGRAMPAQDVWWNGSALGDLHAMQTVLDGVLRDQIGSLIDDSGDQNHWRESGDQGGRIWHLKM